VVFAERLLSSALCKAPVVICTLQSTCCHQHFAKRLLSSALCKAPVVIMVSQRKLKE
jgi:hypothetical protein